MGWPFWFLKWLSCSVGTSGPSGLFHTKGENYKNTKFEIIKYVITVGGGNWSRKSRLSRRFASAGL